MNIILPLLDLNAALEAMIQKEGGGRYSCLECGRNMADKSKIKRHAEIHLNIAQSCSLTPALELYWPCIIQESIQTKSFHLGQ